MHEVFANLDHVPTWRAALRGRQPDWRSFLAGYDAAVDWPVAAFWSELTQAFPDAVVVLSVRDDARDWWESANETVLEVARHDQPDEYRDWHGFFLELLESKLTPDWNDPAAAMAAYERHNASVRRVLGGRLVEWHVEQGWEPICRALGVAVPAEPFPHLNVRAEWMEDR